MVLVRLLVRWGAALLAPLAPSLATPAAAQLRPQPVPAVLSEVLLVSQSPTESRFRLTVTPKVNGFATVGTDPGRPALGLALTSRGNSAVAPPGLDGLVRGIAFDQVDSVLVMRFATSAPAAASAVTISDTTIEITVSSRTARASRTSDDSPPHRCRPPPPQRRAKTCSSWSCSNMPTSAKWWAC